VIAAALLPILIHLPSILCCRAQTVCRQHRRACHLTGTGGRRSKGAQYHSACQQQQPCAAVMALLQWLSTVLDSVLAPSLQVLQPASAAVFQLHWCVLVAVRFDGCSRYTTAIGACCLISSHSHRLGMIGPATQQGCTEICFTLHGTPLHPCTEGGHVYWLCA
jgi:hypothetical protein